MHYEHILQKLLSVNLHGGIKLGLNNCLRLNHALGAPVDNFAAIHVAGTNGKGSVVTKIAAGLQASGKKVGLYTSPHIACFRERIRINGVMISEAAMQKHLARIFSLVEELQIPATFFEITTLLAFAYFAEEQIDIAVVETGLGGRLDATNIIKPILTIITSISLDHTEILGSTLEAIAKEKAGIIKSGIPLILGPRLPTAYMQELAAVQQSPCLPIHGDFDDFRAENTAIAEYAMRHLDLEEHAVVEGLKACPPCRLQIWLPEDLINIMPDIQPPKAVVLDVAHNPDGLTHLIGVLKQRFAGASMRFVVGLSKSKDISACLNVIEACATHMHLVEAPNARAASINMLYETLLRHGAAKEKITCELSTDRAIRHAAIAAGQHPNEIVIVCGTFFIMADARATLGISEPQDPLPLQEVLR